MYTFQFKIVSPERVVFEAKVSQATLPTSTGQITVLPHHIPLVSNLVPGEIVIHDENGQERMLAISGGFTQVFPDKIVVLADTAEMAHEISENQAVEAHKRAEDLLKAKGGVRDKEFAALQVMMDKELARLKVVRRYKQRGISGTDLK